MSTDLALAGRLVPGDDGTRFRVPAIGPTGDPLLDEGLRRFAAHDGRRLSDVLGKAGHRLEHEVGLYLAARGVVRVEQAGVLHRERHPMTSPVPRDALVERLAQVLCGRIPTPIDSAVVGLVHANGVLPRIVDARALGMHRRELDRRAALIATGGGPGVRALQCALAANQAAAMAALASPGTTT